LERADTSSHGAARRFAFAAAAERGAGLVLSFAFEVDRRDLADGDVEQSFRRAEGRAEPDGGAVEIRPHQRAGFAGLGAGVHDGAAAIVEAFGPRLLRIRAA